MATAGFAPEHDPAKSFTLDGVPGPVYLAEKESQEIDDQRRDAISEVKRSLYHIPNGSRRVTNGDHARAGNVIDVEEEIALFLADPAIPLSQTMKEYNLRIPQVVYLLKKYGIARQAPAVPTPVVLEPLPAAPTASPAPEPGSADCHAGHRLMGEEAKRRRERIANMLQQGMGYAEIAKAEGIDESAVSYHALKLGLGKGDARTKRNEPILADLREGKLNACEVAAKHSVSVSTVSHLAVRNRISTRNQVRVLVEPEHQERIRALLNQGMDYVSIARTLGVSLRSVNRYIADHGLGKSGLVQQRNEHIFADLGEGKLSSGDIAAKHHVTAANLHSIAKRHGFSLRDRSIYPESTSEVAPEPVVTPAARSLVAVPAPEPEPFVMVVEDGIPLPPRNRAAESPKYHRFLSLKPGQSAFVPESFAKIDNLCTSIGKMGKRQGMKFAYRREVKDGVKGTRVWRVK